MFLMQGDKFESMRCPPLAFIIQQVYLIHYNFHTPKKDIFAFKRIPFFPLPLPASLSCIMACIFALFGLLILQHEGILCLILDFPFYVRQWPCGAE